MNPEPRTQNPEPRTRNPARSVVTFPVTARTYTRFMTPHLPRVAPRDSGQVADSEWITFPGGELEGKRPKVLCAECRQQLKQAAVAGAAPAMGRRTTLCFQCYRAELDRDKAIKAAGELDTASVERFQTTLPFEQVNVPRLEMLKADRASASHANHAGL